MIAVDPRACRFRFGSAGSASQVDRLHPAYSVEKLDRRFSGDDFGGLKPSPDQFASL